MDLLRPLLFNKSLLLIFMTVVESKVEWYVISDPVRIGSDLKLFCNTTQNSCRNCISRWYSGKTVLAIHDTVIDPTKYALSLKEEGVTLTIKDLTMNDTHRPYQCLYNFDIYTKDLTLPETFEYQPTKDTAYGSHSLEGKDLHLSFVFEEVHPKPLCSVHLNEEDLSSKLTYTLESRGSFLNVKYELNHTLKVDQSGGELHFECSVGTITETYYDVYIGDDGDVYIGDDGDVYVGVDGDVYIGNDGKVFDDASPVWIIIGLVCGILFISLIVCLRLHRKHKLFDTCMDYNSPCILCWMKNTEHTDNKTDTDDSSKSEKKNVLTTYVIISGDEDKKEPAGEESVPTEIKDGSSTHLLFHRSPGKEIPINNVNTLSVSHDYTRSDSSCSSDTGIDCLARDRHQNCKNTTESNQSQLSIALEENLLDRKKDHATLQVIS